MKNLLTNCLLVVVFILTASFAENKKLQQRNAPVTFLKCNNSEQEASHNFADYQIIDVVKLETEEDALMAEIRQIECVDDLFVILDGNDQLFVFDRQGHFKNRIGTQGEGPDQYLGFNGFFVDREKNVVIADNMKSCLIKYSITGEHISSAKVPISGIQYSSQAIRLGNQLLLYNGLGLGDNMAYAVLNLESYQLGGKFFPYAPLTTNNYLLYFSNHPMTPIEDRIDFILPLCDTIYSFDGSSFSPRYIAGHPGRMARRSQIRKNTPNYPQDIRDLNRAGFFTGFTALFETTDHILLDYKDQGVVLGYFLFNKKQAAGNYYLYTHDPETKKIPFYTIVGSTAEFMIGTSLPESLMNNPVKVADQSAVNMKFKKIIQESLEDDNPILFIYKLNNL